jgi:SsrA-binding protein
MAKKKKPKANSATIARNKKATHDYFIMEEFDAGLSLQGWEVKSMREGRVQIKEAYVINQNGELFLFGAHITPLIQASSHVIADPVRSRKLLLNKKEIHHLIGSVDRKGFTMIPLSLFWKRGKVKCNIALGKGKKLHDKRESIKRPGYKIC